MSDKRKREDHTDESGDDDIDENGTDEEQSIDNRDDHDDDDDDDDDDDSGQRSKKTTAKKSSSSAKTNAGAKRAKNEPSASSSSDVAIEDEEDELKFVPIEELQSAGISMGDITKLKESGYLTQQDVAYAPMRQLLQIKGITEAKANRLMTECAKRVPMGFTSGDQLAIRRRRRIKITTGSRELDKLLKGGVETQSVTEVSGESGSGKSQICFQLCVTCQLPKSQGGGEGKAMYIDTEGTFSHERIEQIAERYGLDAEQVLSNITYARAFNVDHQTQLLDQARQLMREQPYALIVVDSSMGLYRLDYQGRGELSERQQHLGKFLRKLLGLCDTFGVAALLTNQVTATPDGMSMFGPQSKAIGGHVMGHAATTRLGLRKGRANERKIKINDSPHLAGDECVVRIYDGGVGDVE